MMAYTYDQLDEHAQDFCWCSYWPTLDQGARHTADAIMTFRSWRFSANGERVA